MTAFHLHRRGATQNSACPGVEHFSDKLLQILRYRLNAEFAEISAVPYWRFAMEDSPPPTDSRAFSSRRVLVETSALGRRNL